MDANVRPTMLEPDFSDQNLTFDGKMRMGAGRAFSIDSHGNGQPGRDSIRVGKHFESITDGGSERRVLIEAVIFRDAQNLMRALPVSPNHTIITNASNFPRSTNLLARSSSRLLPPRHLAQNSNQKFRNAHRRRW
jgi:hypothetical protein